MNKRYISYSLAIVSFALLSAIQLKWVSESVFASPITSPVTLPITSPVVTTSPTPTQAPITSPVVLPIPTETPTPTPAPTTQNSSNSSNSDSNSNNNNSNNNSNPYVCTDSKPKSAPRLISARVIGQNNVALTWTRAQDPVTSYLIAFGRKKGVMEYGVPNAGGRDTTSYTINGLTPFTTYYFMVRAGNNCMPGDFSNEMSIQVRGGNQSILSSKTTTITKQSNIAAPGIKVLKTIKKIEQTEPVKQKTVPAQNAFSKITKFFSSLFNR